MRLSPAPTMGVPDNPVFHFPISKDLAKKLQLKEGAIQAEIAKASSKKSKLLSKTRPNHRVATTPG